ncbi:MAG: 50S ribosome-binding GTPase, partial [Magnetococcales bacterium]|nr:50S ribosome-binding GTPase [Magnetococcales bacterium]
TGATVLAEDQLFATLDPTVRRIRLPNGEKIIISDTVGFIRDLPHQLVAAFRATLEETLEADLLLHVVDLSDPEWEEQAAAVMETLQELAVNDKPLLTLYNKSDLLPPESGLIARLEGRGEILILSSVTGHGIGALLEILGRESRKNARVVQLNLPATAGALLARLCQEGRVMERQDVEDRIHLTLTLSPIARGRLDPWIREYLLPPGEA